jgi:hypothetical protein
MRHTCDIHAPYKLQDELQRLEYAWREQKDVAALLGAVHLCGETRQPLPDWASIGIQQTLVTMIRGPNWAVHYERWDTVLEVRDRYSVPWEVCYERAAEALKDAPSPDAVKKSYQLIQREFRSGKRAYLVPLGKNNRPFVVSVRRTVLM